MLLEELASHGGGTGYVFQGWIPGKHFQGIGKVWGRVRKSAKLDDVRLHDLRHSFASAAARGGLNLPMIGALLGHKNPATTQRYVHLVGNAVHEASETAGAQIAPAFGKGGGNSQPFRSLKLANSGMIVIASPDAAPRGTVIRSADLKAAADERRLRAHVRPVAGHAFWRAGATFSMSPSPLGRRQSVDDAVYPAGYSDAKPDKITI